MVVVLGVGGGGGVGVLPLLYSAEMAAHDKMIYTYTTRCCMDGWTHGSVDDGWMDAFCIQIVVYNVDACLALCWMDGHTYENERM